MNDLRRHDWLAVALLILLPTLFFGDVLVGSSNFGSRDLTRFYYPVKQIYREIIGSGEFPLWNRYAHAGQPLAANPEHEIFYPFTWLLMLPSFDTGYRLHILVHFYVGLLAMYALLRSMHVRPPAGFFGAVSFGLGGLFLSSTNLLPCLFSAAWLPLTCLFTRRFLLLHRRRDFALAALFLGLQCLVAEPTTILQTVALLGMYALYRGWVDGRDAPRSRPIRMLRSTLSVGLVGLSGFAVGAVQLVPAIDLARDSIRAQGFPFDQVATWSMPWARLAEIVYPGLLGRVGLEMTYWGARLYEGPAAPFLYSIYPGLGVAALLAAAFVVRPRGGGFVLIVATLSVVLAAGSNTPVLRVLYDAGLAKGLRYPEKFVLMAIFAGTILAARLLDRALAGDENVRRAAAAFALATAVVSGSIAAAWLHPAAVDAWLRGFGLPRNEFTLDAAVIAWKEWGIAAGRGLVLFALFWTIPRLPRRWWLVGGLVFLVSDLALLSRRVAPRLPADFFTRAPATEALLPPNRADFRVFHEAAWHTDAATSRKYFSGREAPYWVARNGLFPPVRATSGIQTVLESDYDATALLPTRHFTAALWQVRQAGTAEWWKPFMEMSNAWFRAVYRPFEQEVQRIDGDYTRVIPVEFVAEEPVPRYYFAQRIEHVSGAEDFVRRIIEAPHVRRRAFIPTDAFQPAVADVLRVVETPSRAEIDVVATGRALLVMSVTRHKYWNITLDGSPVEAVPVNLAYQGVVVPPGPHRVVMRYRNPLIHAGAVISILAAAALLLATRSGRRRVVSS